MRAVRDDDDLEVRTESTPTDRCGRRAAPVSALARASSPTRSESATRAAIRLIVRARLEPNVFGSMRKQGQRWRATESDR